MIQYRKLLAVLLTATCTAISMPAIVTSGADDVLYETGFENDEIVFTGRGGTEVLEASTEAVHSGEYALCVSERSQGWHGPQFLLDDLCKPFVEYTISAWVKSEWYSTLNLSMEYTDSNGIRQYMNLKSAQGDSWFEFSDVKVSFTDDVTNVYVYFEASDNKCKLYVDDFVLKAAPIIPIQDDLLSLSDLYSEHFMIGTGIMNSNLSSPSFMDLVKKHFDRSMTFGNELKPENVLDLNATLAYMEQNDGDDTNPQVTLSAARSLLKYCQATNTPVRGHVLVWHSQTPDWFFKEGFSDSGEWVDKEKMLVRMENYIKNVFAILEAEYPDVNIYAWDVVNEAFLDSGDPRSPGSDKASSGQSAWVKVFGDNSFIEPAFTYARKYAPAGTKLYYNDFNEYIEGKMNAIYQMAMDLKAKGLIDGIGMQSHMDVTFPSAAQFKTALAKYATTGLDIQITELDITTKDTSAAGLEKQAQMYSDIMDACVEYSDHISAVVFWGVTDDQSWRGNQVPLLFDGSFQAKPAYYAIVDGMEMPDIIETTTTTVTNPSISDQPDAKMPGDVNDDGVIKIDDVVLMNRYIGEDTTIELSKTGLLNANCDGIKGVDADDATHLLKYLAGLIAIEDLH